MIATAKRKQESPEFDVTRPNLSLADRVEKGFPLRSIDELRDGGFTPGEVYTLILPARTLKHRRQKKQNLSPEETDRVVRLRKITSLADRVFGNHDRALGWLRRANSRLKGRAPLDMLRTEVGGNFIEEMLYQIDEGIYV
ncbi:MAG: DUF2384 domain-containing protein [Acidobacteria bacterium]|nr:DUF2384 domain-containing protein [Acidobacteriota bacterium]